MVKPAVSRDAFRGLFALFAAKAHHDHKHDREYHRLTRFASTRDIPDCLLELWSDRAQLLGSEIVGDILSPRTRQIADGSAHYDHASDFLHALLRDMYQKAH
jgi:hypothetical protein